MPLRRFRVHFAARPSLTDLKHLYKERRRGGRNRTQSTLELHIWALPLLSFSLFLYLERELGKASKEGLAPWRELDMNKIDLISNALSSYFRCSSSYELEYSSYTSILVYDLDLRSYIMLLAYELVYSSCGNSMIYILVYSSYDILQP